MNSDNCRANITKIKTLVLIEYLLAVVIREIQTLVSELVAYENNSYYELLFFIQKLTLKELLCTLFCMLL